MRKLVHIAAAAVALAGGVGWGAAAWGATAGSPTGGAVAATAGSGSNCTGSGLSRVLFHAPDLTVATESPSYPPWFVADDPANGQGFESAMTYALAGQLGVARNRVIWVAEPFGDAVTPGPKAFDFDVDQISVTPARARDVSFSRPYYQVNQALVARKGSRIITVHSPAQLRRTPTGPRRGRPAWPRSPSGSSPRIRRCRLRRWTRRWPPSGPVASTFWWPTGRRPSTSAQPRTW